MEAEMSYLLEEKTRKLENAEMLIERLKREATPEEGYLLEEQGREIATLVKRLANAELLIEKLKEEVGHWEEDFAMFDRAHEKAIDLWRRGLHAGHE